MEEEIVVEGLPGMAVLRCVCKALGLQSHLVPPTLTGKEVLKAGLVEKDLGLKTSPQSWEPPALPHRAPLQGPLGVPRACVSLCHQRTGSCRLAPCPLPQAPAQVVIPQRVFQERLTTGDCPKASHPSLLLCCV